jgi:hypothetical protein
MTNISKIMARTSSTSSISPKRTLFASEEHDNPLKHTTGHEKPGLPLEDTPARSAGGFGGGGPVTQESEQESESGDIDQTFEVS